MVTLFELIDSQANQIFNKTEYSSELKVDEGVKYILEFINERMKLLKPEDITVKIEDKEETPYVKVNWRILSFSIYVQCANFDKVNEYFYAIIKHYLVFNDLKQEKLFLDDTIRIKTMTDENDKILFMPTDVSIPNRIEMEKTDPMRFIVSIYHVN